MNEVISVDEFFIASFIISIAAEIIPVSRRFYLDDNLSIPVFSSILFSLYFNNYHKL